MSVDIKMIFSPYRETGGGKLHKKGRHKKKVWKKVRRSSYVSLDPNLGQERNSR